MTWKTGASQRARRLFQTRRVGAVNNMWNEDGNATTGLDLLVGRRTGVRLTGELIAMTSRRGEYVPAGMPYNRNDTQIPVRHAVFLLAPSGLRNFA